MPANVLPAVAILPAVGVPRLGGFPSSQGFSPFVVSLSNHGGWLLDRLLTPPLSFRPSPE